jgi:hypothetical protein
LDTLKDCLQGHHYVDDESLQNALSQPLQRKELLCSGGLVVHALVQRWKKTVGKDGDLTNNYNFGRTVVQFLKFLHVYILNNMQ